VTGLARTKTKTRKRNKMLGPTRQSQHKETMVAGETTAATA
jgi:hypothetical protein